MSKFEFLVDCTVSDLESNETVDVVVAVVIVMTGFLFSSYEVLIFRFLD